MLPFRVYTPEELRAASRTGSTHSPAWIAAPTPRTDDRSRGVQVAGLQRLFGRRPIGRPAPGTS
jgi:hypothetical protein